MKSGFNQLCRVALGCFAACLLIFPLLARAQPHDLLKDSGKADLVVVHKAERTLELWSHGETIAKYRVALGFNPVGPKEYEGDGRTPEGVYTVILHNAASHYYRSLKLDYPNAADVAAAKAKGLTPGGMIMIHGLPNSKTAAQVGHPARDWTDGCIAVTDDEMENIWTRVENGTAVLIMP